MEGEVDPSINSDFVATNENIKLMPSDAELDTNSTGNNNGNGILQVDAILVYQVDENDHEKAQKAEWRNRYLETLNEFGLDTETVGNYGDYGSIEDQEAGLGKLNFVKIHAPIDVLYEVAEEMQLKMPTRESDITIQEWYEGRAWEAMNKLDPFRLRNRRTKESKPFFVQKFDRERLSEFYNNEDKENFFTPAVRGRLVFSLLEEATFGDNPTDIGIDQLVHRGVFLDAYPIHAGPTLPTSAHRPVNDRQRLQKDWASWACLFRYQPIDAVKEYFGEKVALYFAWLGFYTMFLIPASIVGIMCFVYGVVTAEESPVVQESCADPIIPYMNGTKHLFYMCPLCDRKCSYFLLNVNCLYAKATHYFDNEATLFFALFMSIWATVFLEFWKRRQVSLAHEWHSMGFERNEEQVRPEYTAANEECVRINPVDEMTEIYMPAGKKFRRLLGSVSVVLFFVCLVLIAVFGVVIFRAALNVVLFASKYSVVRQQCKYIVSGCAGVINLIAINVLKQLYNRIAVKLTDWECPRTRTEYEDSFIVKMFLFQFFNTYSSIIYVAFLKSDAIVGSPGNYRRFSSTRFRMDGCSAQGCFLELTIQLIIIMVGQQCINNLMETLLPTLMRMWKDRQTKKELGKKADAHQWVDDFECEMQTKFSLFWEYLEIVLQYGFITMFVAGFPLAPLFALLNNIVEIRVDAYNYIHNCRRPVAHRAEDIGAWFGILATLTSVSVLINAFVLAFTSELIPNLVYKYHVSNNRTMWGYVDWSLSSFNVNDFSNESRPLNATANGIPVQNECRYPGYHADQFPYKRSLDYWMILSARLAFVLCFIIFVLLVSWVICYTVADIPKALELTIKREKFLAKQAEKEHKEKEGKRYKRGTSKMN